MIKNANDQNVFLAPLHGLRGMAVLFVLVSHFSNSGLYLLPVNLGGLGKVGVWLFFSLSAYLLTRQLVLELMRSAQRLVSIRDYLIKRFFRIYPLYVLLLLVNLAGDIDLAGLLRHLLLQEGRGELWAIPVEFKYYMVMPLIAWVAACSGPAVSQLLVVLLLAVAVFFSLAQPQLIFSNDLALVHKIAPFLIGSLLALRTLGSGSGSAHKRAGLAVSIMAILAFVPLAWGFRLAAKELISQVWSPWLSLAMGVCVAVLIYCSLNVSWLERVCKNRALVYFGEISFSLYLLHMLVIYVMLKLPFMSLAVKPWLTLLACVCVAHVSHKWVELPGMQVGKWLIRRLHRRALQRVSPALSADRVTLHPRG